MILKSYVTQLWCDYQTTKAVTWKVNGPDVAGRVLVYINNFVIQGGISVD